MKQWACILCAWSSFVPGYSEGLQVIAIHNTVILITSRICSRTCDNVDLYEVLWRRGTSLSVVIAGQEGGEGCKTVRSRVARRCERKWMG